MNKKLARDVFSTLTTTITNSALGFVSSVIIANYLGPEIQGTLKTVLMLPSLLYTFLNLGIESAMIYFGSRRKNFKSIRSASNKFGLLFLLGSLGAGGAAIIAGSFLFNYYTGVPLAYLLSILLLAPLTFYNGMQAALLRAENEFKRYNLSNTVKQVVYFVAILFVFLYKSAWVVIASNYIMILTGILINTIGVRHKNQEESRPYVKGLVKFGLKTYASSVINFINYRFDILMLTPLVSKAQLGVYSVAQTLSEMIWMIPNSVSIVLLPRIAALDEDGRRAVALRVCRHVATAMAAVVLIAFFSTEFLLPLVFSRKYVGSVLPFKILLGGTFLMTYNRILGSAVAATGRPERNIPANLAGSIVNVLMNIILIPKYGILGAAAAGSVSYGISGLASIIVYLRLNKGSVKLADILFVNRNDVLTLFRLVKRKLASH